MRRPPILTLLGLLLVLAPAARAEDEDGGDLRKILREVEEIRKLAEKAVLQPSEIKIVQGALDETRQQLLKAQQQAFEAKVKLEAAEAELQLYKKNQALLESRIADLENRKQPVEEPIPAPRATPEVHGKISGVAEGGLLVISIGADEGLKVGQSLDVFRAGDPTKALGTLSLVRAYRKQAIGQFQASGGDRPEVGDEVVSRVAPK